MVAPADAGAHRLTLMRLAVLAGHVGLVAGSAIGVTMIVRSVVAADGAAEVVLTSGGGVSLLPAHLRALSGVVVLLSLARVLRRSRLTERRRVAVVALAVAGFLSVGAVVSGATADVLAQPGAFGQFPGALIQVLGLVVALVAGVAALCCARAPR